MENVFCEVSPFGELVALLPSTVLVVDLRCSRNRKRQIPALPRGWEVACATAAKHKHLVHQLRKGEGEHECVLALTHKEFERAGLARAWTRDHVGAWTLTQPLDVAVCARQQNMADSVALDVLVANGSSAA